MLQRQLSNPSRARQRFIPDRRLASRSRLSPRPHHVQDPLPLFSRLWAFLVHRPLFHQSRHSRQPLSKKTTNSMPSPRLELLHPCSPKFNLLTCPDFSASQPRGPASIPHLHGLPCCTSIWDCPRCGDTKPDLQFKRICEFRRAGVSFGPDASRRAPGVDLVCCTVM